MSAKKPKTKENDLKKYLWSLKGKCSGITEVNSQIIDQYIKFSLMVNDLSIQMKESFDSGELAGLEDNIKLYEKLNKIVLGLYKTLKLEEIKEELAEHGDNPYIELMKAESKDDDL